MILLVDDDQAVLSSYAQLFEISGYEVSAHACPKQALDAFRQSPQSFKAIITDHAMPEMTGVDLLQQAKQLNPDIHPILYTGVPPKITADDITIVQKPARFQQILSLILD